MLGIEECPQQSHFDTSKMTEDVERMKMKVDNSSWRIEIVRRLDKKRADIQESTALTDKHILPQHPDDDINTTASSIWNTSEERR